MKYDPEAEQEMALDAVESTLGFHAERPEDHDGLLRVVNDSLARLVDALGDGGPYLYLVAMVLAVVPTEILETPRPVDLTAANLDRLSAPHRLGSQFVAAVASGDSDMAQTMYITAGHHGQEFFQSMVGFVIGSVCNTYAAHIEE